MNLFAKTKATYNTVECGELEQIIAREGDNIGLIDVRTEGEHASGHIPNSENINLMGPDFVSKLEFFDKEKAYYVYCASGNRSRTACSQMMNMGFKNVHNVQMGMMGWTGEVE
ncbi:MAG: rhodanese-like domain-containing protein [Cytophagales bacterium]|nr:rhodanese-like domain-containing protein [Cytophagales bacterium]